MSNLVNETILENIFEQFLEEGHTEAQAEKLAMERIEQIPTPWGWDCDKKVTPSEKMNKRCIL